MAIPRERPSFWLVFGALAALAVAACSADGRNPDVVGDTLLPGDAGSLACATGETKCVSATEAAACGPDLRWGASVSCGGGCFEGRCQSGECGPGSSECLSLTRLRRCSELGLWSAPEECEYACVEGLCDGVCKPGQTRCASDSTVETCSPEGQWGAATPCASGCSGDACLGECTFGDARCASSTQEQSCNELGQWLIPVSCLNACVGVACGGECTPNATRCASTTTLESCGTDGTWGSPTECTNVCVGSACGGDCSPGAGRCDAITGLPQVCSVGGTWEARAACPFVCSGDGECTGECTPGSERCNPQTGIPQLCGNDGTYQNQAPCRPGEVCTASGGGTSCGCQGDLDTCSDGCFDLDTDANNCGACGHSCQGQTCSAGRCTPQTLVADQVVTHRMALSDRDLFFVNAEGDLARVFKQSGAVQFIAISSGVQGVAVDGTSVYWAFNSPTALEIARIDANENFVTFTSGIGPVGFAYRSLVEFNGFGAAVGTDAVNVSGGFVYWAANGYRRAATSAAIPVSPGQLLGTQAETGLLAPAGACVYAVGTDQTTIFRACANGNQAPVYVGANFIEDIVADGTGVYFSERLGGIRRMSLNTDLPTITTLAPTSNTTPTAVAVDDDFVYFIDGMAANVQCTSSMSINRVSKNGGPATALVSPAAGCPKFVSVDDAFVYWATWSDDTGSINRVAK